MINDIQINSLHDRPKRVQVFCNFVKSSKIKTSNKFTLLTH